MAAGQVRAPLIVPLINPEISKSKIINTLTKIDLISETNDVDIYFTIDGSKPEPFNKSAVNNTFRFKKPFSLPEGKRIIKALAVSKNGSRESNVVTKVFEIENFEHKEYNVSKIDEDTYGYLDELKTNEDNKLKLKSNIFEITSKKMYSELVPGHSKNQEIINSGDKSKNNSSIAIEDSFKYLPIALTNNYSQSLKLHREVDFMRCSYCMSLRPSDKAAKFCHTCGQVMSPLPQSRLPLPENGQLGVCIHCRSTVPMTVMNCLVCEAPIANQNIPQASINLKDRILCSECGTTNPSNIEYCLTCESFLMEKGKVMSLQNRHSNPIDSNEKSSVLKKCLKCMRQNNFFARYCDWCGNNLLLVNKENKNYYISCFKCNASNSIEAVFCCQCGLMIINPYRHHGNPITNAIEIPLYPNDESSIIQLPSKSKKLVDIETQTIGLFYPSSASLKNTDKNKLENNKDDWIKRKSGPISPGKGYWRNQIDHVVTHLKAHVSNDGEFQALIGEPRMGKLISANIEEEDYEMNLILTFALKGYKEPYKSETSEIFEKKYLNNLLKRTNSLESFCSDNTIKSNNSKRNNLTSITGKTKQPTKRQLSARSSKSNQIDSLSDLLKEIGKGGSGRVEKLKYLFEQGLDMKGKTKKGTPFMNLAIKNKHFDAAFLFVEFGVNINERDLENGNSSLHEAVLLGNNFEKTIQKLLELGAEINIKNKNGETPLDLARKVNNQAAVVILTAKMGKIQIDEIIQPRTEEIMNL